MGEINKWPQDMVEIQHIKNKAFHLRCEKKEKSKPLQISNGGPLLMKAGKHAL